MSKRREWNTSEVMEAIRDRMEEGHGGPAGVRWNQYGNLVLDFPGYSWEVVLVAADPDWHSDGWEEDVAEDARDREDSPEHADDFLDTLEGLP